MSEYIGSQISLISKSDIKYVGTLHEINSENSTVALENVRSYGTEDRRHGSEEVPPSDTVFAYIVFRGSDVKELSIVEAPKENQPPAAVPNDPAILGSSRPPPQQQQQQQRQQYQPPPPPQHNQYPGPQYQQPYDFQQGPPQFQPPPPRFQGPGGPHGFPGQPGAVPGYNGFGPPPNYGMGYPPPGPPFGQHPPPPPPNAQYSPAQQHPIAPPGQRASKPDTQPRAQKPAEMSGTPAPAAQATSAKGGPPPPPLDSKPNSAAQAAAVQAATTTSEQKPMPKKAPSNKVAVPLAAATKAPSKPAPKVTAPQTYTDATEAATAAVAEAMAKLHAEKPANVDNLAQRVNQMRVQDTPRGRPRGRVGAPRSGRRDPRAVDAPKQVYDFALANANFGKRDAGAVDVPREDYDFALANAKFNKQEMIKQAIAGDSPVASPGADGENSNTFDNGAANDDVVVPPKPAEKGYDKKSSFFDDLSSDLKDRHAVQSFDGRAMRREERSKNMETFGQGSVDGGQRGGGFRGRGRGRGRGGYGRPVNNGQNAPAQAARAAAAGSI